MRSLLLAAVIVCAGAPAAHAEADHQKVARDAVSKVIQPGYHDLAEAAKNLKKKTDTLCAAPSEPGFAATKEAFAAAVARWSRVEIFRFGPANHKHRFERLFFWPDPKGIGLRQAQRALIQKDESVTAEKTLGEKSVALQGLPALEYLLYGNGAEGLSNAGDTGAFRCRFAAAIAANMATITEDLKEAWGDDAPFTKAFLDPGPNDPLYRSRGDVTLELYKAFSGGIELVRDQKLGKPLGETAELARPRLAAFWRSDLTFPNMAGNLEAVHALFVDGGFADIVASVSPGVEKSVLFDLDRVTKILGAESKPMAEAVSEPASRNKLEALRIALKSARDTASAMIAEGADLSFGFNALDGD
jgi:uncharacterized protein